MYWYVYCNATEHVYSMFQETWTDSVIILFYTDGLEVKESGLSQVSCSIMYMYVC